MKQLKNRRKDIFSNPIIMAVIITLLLVPVQIFAAKMINIFNAPDKVIEQKFDAIAKKAEADTDKLRIETNEQFKSIKDALKEVKEDTKLLIKMHLNANK